MIDQLIGLEAPTGWRTGAFRDARRFRRRHRWNNPPTWLKERGRRDDAQHMESELRFDTDDHEFVRGFEIGVLWERLSVDPECEITVHASNAEMVMRVAKAVGCQFSGRDLGDDRIFVELHKVNSC